MYSLISVTVFYTMSINIFVFETPYSVSALFGNTLYYSIVSTVTSVFIQISICSIQENHISLLLPLI